MVIRPLDDRTYCAHLPSLVLGFGGKVLYDSSSHHFTASQYVIECAHIEILSISNRLAAIWNEDFSTPRFEGLGGRGESGIDSFDGPPDPDTMTITALKAIASSSSIIKSWKIRNFLQILKMSWKLAVPNMYFTLTSFPPKPSSSEILGNGQMPPELLTPMPVGLMQMDDSNLKCWDTKMVQNNFSFNYNRTK